MCVAVCSCSVLTSNTDRICIGSCVCFPVLFLLRACSVELYSIHPRVRKRFFPVGSAEKTSGIGPYKKSYVLAALNSIRVDLVYRSVFLSIRPADKTFGDHSDVWSSKTFLKTSMNSAEELFFPKKTRKRTALFFPLFFQGVKLISGHFELFFSVRNCFSWK